MKRRKRNNVTDREKRHTDIALQAMLSNKALLIGYRGRKRTIEPHSIGTDKRGRIVLQCWQVDGGSESGACVGWKTIRLDDVESMHVSDMESGAPQKGFKSKGAGFDEVLYDIEECLKVTNRAAARSMRH